MNHWSERLWKALNWKGWSQRELARRAEIDEQKVYKYLQGRVDQPRGDTMLRLADILGVSEIWLKFGTGPATVNIPVVGRVTTGETFIPLDDGIVGSSPQNMKFALSEGDPIAVEIGNDSLRPVYRAGDILLCSRMRGEEIRECLNRDCVVRTDQGEGYIKQIMEGKEANKYNLISYNTPPILDVGLLWAAPVLWVKRG